MLLWEMVMIVRMMMMMMLRIRESLWLEGKLSMRRRIPEREEREELALLSVKLCTLEC